MRRALITGGAGFIGSSVARRLAADASVERIIVVDDFSSGSTENLDGLCGRVELVEADIRDRGRLAPHFQGIDTVFHFAAIASVTRSMREPVLCHEVNVDGTFNVLRLAHEAGARRVVFASSSAAYGDAPGLPKREDMPPAPHSAYAVHKLVGENYLRTYFENYGLETVALRFFNVYGPRQAPASPYSGVVSLFCRAALERRRPTIFGDGEQTRDFIFIDDIVELCLRAARSGAAAGRVYNGGRGERVSLNRLWAALAHIEGVDLDPDYGPPREGDVRHSQADITAAREELGFQPTVELEQGLHRTLDWMRGRL